MDTLFSKWLKEVKPFLWQIFQDLAILRRGAHILGEPIYIFNDDAKDYFNQLAIAECDLHKLGIVFLDSADRTAPSAAELVFVSERRLGFGRVRVSPKQLLGRGDRTGVVGTRARRGHTGAIPRHLDLRLVAAVGCLLRQTFRPNEQPRRALVCRFHCGMFRWRTHRRAARRGSARQHQAQRTPSSKPAHERETPVQPRSSLPGLEHQHIRR